MMASHPASTSSPCSSSTVDNGLTSQAYTLPTFVRKNSFDLVIAVANDRAAADSVNGTTVQASTAAVDGSTPYSPDRESLARVPSCQKSKIFDVESQMGSFEEIDLQEWPTASRIAATNSDFAAFQASTPSQRQVTADRQDSSATAIALAFQVQASSGNIGFWGSWKPYFGL
jgi:hypothetical protein